MKLRWTWMSGSNPYWGEASLNNGLKGAEVSVRSCGCFPAPSNPYWLERRDFLLLFGAEVEISV